MLDVMSPVDGNKYAVDILEKMLAECRKGDISHASVILVKGPVDVTVSFGGLSGREIAANFGADILKKNLIEASLKRMMAPQNVDAPADRFYYDCYRMPVSFDFSCVLINAEMARVREGAPAPLKVAWYFGPENDINKALNTPERMQSFHGIFRPLVQLIGGVEDPTAINGRTTDNCNFAPVVEAFRRGEALPKFTAPPEYRMAIEQFMAESNTLSPVTITLRECEHSIHRNSNLPEWIRMADWLKEQGHDVIIIRDTARSREEIPGHLTCYAASEDLLVRHAVYETAKANLLVSNGPMILCTLGQRPYLVFNEIQDDSWYRAGTTAGWENNTGVAAGGQWPWARSDQRMVWGRDNFENIRDAWLEHIAPSLSRRASGYQLEEEEERIEAAE